MASDSEDPSQCDEGNQESTAIAIDQVGPSPYMKTPPRFAWLTTSLGQPLGETWCETALVRDMVRYRPNLKVLIHQFRHFVRAELCAWWIRVPILIRGVPPGWGLEKPGNRLGVPLDCSGRSSLRFQHVLGQWLDHFGRCDRHECVSERRQGQACKDSHGRKVQMHLFRCGEVNAHD